MSEPASEQSTSIRGNASRDRGEGLRGLLGSLAPVLLISGLLFYALLQVRRPLVAGMHGNDFWHLFIGSKAVLEGENLYDSGTVLALAAREGIERINPYVYLPFTAILLSPLTLFSPRDALVAWFFLNHLFFLLSVVFLTFSLPRASRMPGAAGLILLGAFFHPLTRTLTAGQLNLLLLVLVSGAILMLRKGRWIGAGIAVGLAVMVKVSPLFLLLFLAWKRRWRAFLAGCATIGILLLFSILFRGPGYGLRMHGEARRMFSQMAYGSSTWASLGATFHVDPGNVAPASAIYRLLTHTRTVYGPIAGLADRPDLARHLATAFSLALVGGLLWVTRKKREEEGTAIEFGTALAASLAVPSLCWDHYLVLLFPAGAFFLYETLRKRRWGSALFWLVPLIQMARPYDFWNLAFREGWNTLLMAPQTFTLLVFIGFGYQLCAGLPGERRKWSLPFPLHRLRSLWIPGALFLLALFFRVSHVLTNHPPLVSDMLSYTEVAHHFLSGRGLVMNEEYKAYRAPLYPLFLAVQFSAAGQWETEAGEVLRNTGEPGLRFVRLVQAFIGALVAPLVYWLGLLVLREAGGAIARTARSAATVAALCAAAFDSLIFYTSQILTEAWYIPMLVLLGCLLFLRNEKRGGIMELLRGVLLGLLCLLRPGAVFLGPAVLIARKMKGATWKGLILLLAGTAGVILPWTLRNYLALGTFIPITTNSGVNLHIGHLARFDYLSYGYKETVRQELRKWRMENPSEIPLEVEEERIFKRLAMEYIRENPGQTLLRAFQKVYHLYHFTSPAFSSEPRTIYRPWPWPPEEPHLRFAFPAWLPTVSWSLPFALIAGAGFLLALFRWRIFLPIFLLLFFHTLCYMVFFGRTRFGVPMMPFFCVFAAFAMQRGLLWAFPGKMRIRSDE